MNTDFPNYTCNPDVVLREEDEDGGLLFNPDTNQVKVLNHTGLFIWKLCDSQHNFPALVAELRNYFEEIPDGEVEQHVKEYLDGLIQDSFIGLVETTA